MYIFIYLQCFSSFCWFFFFLGTPLSFIFFCFVDLQVRADEERQHQHQYHHLFHPRSSSQRKTTTASAVALYERAAELGHAAAQHNLAVLLLRGDRANGVDPNPRRALGLLQQASGNGLAEATLHLGVSHCYGSLDLPIEAADPVYGACLLRSVAEKGHVGAQLQYGICCALGLGVRKDALKARDWLAGPAQKGSVQAQFNLGVLLDDGGPLAVFGPSGDWLRAAATHGHSDAIYNLGCMHARQGGRKARQRAAKHFQRAARLGHQAAAENAARLLKE